MYKKRTISKAHQKQINPAPSENLISTGRTEEGLHHRNVTQQPKKKRTLKDVFLGRHLWDVPDECKRTNRYDGEVKTDCTVSWNQAVGPSLVLGTQTRFLFYFLNVKKKKLQNLWSISHLSKVFNFPPVPARFYTGHPHWNLVSTGSVVFIKLMLFIMTLNET